MIALKRIALLCWLCASTAAFVCAQHKDDKPTGKRILPTWLPAELKKTKVRYLYLPAIETYYDITTGKYHFYNGTQWEHVDVLPDEFRGQRLNKTGVVPIPFTGARVYENHRHYRYKYPPESGKLAQPDSTLPK